MDAKNNCCEFYIGEFGDIRRQEAGEALFASIADKGSLSIRKLASSRAEQVRFQRFLWNEDVSLEEMKEAAFDRTADMAKGIEHVLCIQDTTEVDLGKMNDTNKNVGSLVNRKNAGFYLHPALAVDAADCFVLGLCGYMDFSYETGRAKRDHYKKGRAPIEEKDSYRWIAAAEEAKQVLAGAKMITIISDRESDIYEYLARIPDDKTFLLVRSRLDRPLVDSDSECKWMSSLVDKLVAQDIRKLQIEKKSFANSVSGKIKKQQNREKRDAKLELRYSQIVIRQPVSRGFRKSKSEAKAVALTVIDVKEVLPLGITLPKGEKPLHWRLLTTHPAESTDAAWAIVEMYKKRWHIEQLFRSAKRGGMRIEDIGLIVGDAAKKLALLGVLASVRILQMTLCRDGIVKRSAAEAFTNEECEALEKIGKKLEGKTVKQKNPHLLRTMAWAHWIVARLGGWKGYLQSEGPAGPITLKHGLDKLASMIEGWRFLRDDDVCMT